MTTEQLIYIYLVIGMVYAAWLHSKLLKKQNEQKLMDFKKHAENIVGPTMTNIIFVVVIVFSVAVDVAIWPIEVGKRLLKISSK